jgi:outer membrane protein OmpU
MNNIKKIGLTALAGSLVSLGSATAGEMSVSGAINTTLKFGKGGGNTTRSLGTDKDVTFSGGGELDNGTTFSMSTTLDDTYAVSASTTTIATPSLGTFSLGASNGSVSYMFDEEVPQAYEQVSDGKQTMANLVGNFMDNNHIMYAAPQLELMGATINAYAAYSPQADDGTNVTDGGQVTYDATIGAGKEAGIKIAYDALTLGFYGAERDRTVPQTAAATGNYQTDEFNGVWYATYSMGPVSIGYSESYMDAGVTQAIETTNAAKVERTAGGIFTGEQMSIAFNVNDNMSISYTTSDETYDTQDNVATAVTTDDDVTETIDAIQVAYSMGGMSIKAYNMEITNPDQDDNAADQSVTEIALGFAF